MEVSQRYEEIQRTSCEGHDLHVLNGTTKNSMRCMGESVELNLFKNSRSVFQRLEEMEVEN